MSDHVYIGNREVWGGEEPFGLSAADRRQHVYVIGKTGTGKSTLLRNLLIQDIEAGRGVGLLDPHGDLAEELLDCIPSRRTDHVVYFNPADVDFPIGLNLFRSVPQGGRHLVASGVVSAFKSIWRDSWGPRTEYILYAGVAALLDCENASILGLPRLLTDPRYRLWVLKQVKDPIVKAFWEREFAGYEKRFLAEVIAPVQNKVGQLLMAAPIRNILGQVKSKISMRFMMDNRRIFIANLSKGQIGADKANLLGALLVTEFQLAAMGRSSVPEYEREDFYLSIDEFHNFSTDSFASILSEARKYRLCLTLSHQYVEQLPHTIRDAVFGNAGTTVSFRVGESDAAVLAREYGAGFTGSHFADLANHEAMVKALRSGATTDPFRLRTFGPLRAAAGQRELVIERSRLRYANSRVDVEDKVRRWLRN